MTNLQAISDLALERDDWAKRAETAEARVAELENVCRDILIGKVYADTTHPLGEYAAMVFRWMTLAKRAMASVSTDPAPAKGPPNPETCSHRWTGADGFRRCVDCGSEKLNPNHGVEVEGRASRDAAVDSWAQSRIPQRASDPCHKCGRTSGVSLINDGDDGDDGGGPVVCVDCYDPDWKEPRTTEATTGPRWAVPSTKDGDQINPGDLIASEGDGVYEGRIMRVLEVDVHCGNSSDILVTPAFDARVNEERIRVHGSFFRKAPKGVSDLLAALRQARQNHRTSEAGLNHAPEARVHELKTWPEPYAKVHEGVKRHEIRKNDRGYLLGDELLLREYDPTTEKYTGAWCRVRVTWISYGGSWGLPDDICVMSIEPCFTTKPETDAMLAAAQAAVRTYTTEACPFPSPRKMFRDDDGDWMPVLTEQIDLEDMQARVDSSMRRALHAEAELAKVRSCSDSPLVYEECANIALDYAPGCLGGVPIAAAIRRRAAAMLTGSTE